MFKKLFLGILILVFGAASAYAQETPVLEPIVQYEFNDPDNLGKDSMGHADLSMIGTVTQGILDEGVHTAVFNGKSALAQAPLADRDVTDSLPAFTVTLWGKHPANQPAHSFMLGTGVAYSTVGFGMGFYAGNDAYIVPLGGIQDGAYAVNYRFPYETKQYHDQTAWNLFALTIDSDKAYFSVNGEVYAVKGIPEGGMAIRNLGQTLTLGGIYNNDHDVFYNGFKGELADVRIYGCALTEEQLGQLHQMGPCGGHLPLTGSFITSVKTPDISDLTVAKKTAASQVLNLLDEYAIPFTTADGAAHENGRALWTAITENEEGFTVEGLVYHPEHANPEGLTVTVDVPFGSSRSIQLPCIFSNGMLLQRNEEVRIFGAGGAQGDTLTVEFAGQTVEASFADDAWEAVLPPMEACTEGRTMTISYTRKGESKPHQVFTLSDVLVGEVWLCSGQSNMAYTIREMLNSPGCHPDFYADYQAIDNWDKLRFYTYPYGEASTPQVNYSRMMTWQSPDNIGQCTNLSGMALAYATHLQAMLGEDVPVGMVISSVGGACIEEWLDEATMATLPSHAASMGKKDCRFYNAMIHPIEGYTVKGVLWYQGEANAMWPKDYQKQFAAYANLYRGKFHNDGMPIVVMQLPQFDEDLYPVFRGAQWELMEQIDNIHVVCGIDLGDPDNIHPTDKYPFGARAAGLALEKVYGLAPVEGMPYGLSPAITKVERTEEGLLLTLSNAQVLTGPEEIEGFMIMADRLWHETTATLRGNQILVKCSKDNVTYFNYLQDTSFPGMDFVYNEYGLPVAPLTYTAVPQ